MLREKGVFKNHIKSEVQDYLNYIMENSQFTVRFQDLSINLLNLDKKTKDGEHPVKIYMKVIAINYTIRTLHLMLFKHIR